MFFLPFLPKRRKKPESNPPSRKFILFVILVLAYAFGSGKMQSLKNDPYAGTNTLSPVEVWQNTREQKPMEKRQESSTKTVEPLANPPAN